MKISSKIFSIPPYISTRWEYVQSLRVSNNLLIATLKDGSSCSIPDLSKDTIEQIFTYHADSVETSNQQKEDLAQMVEGMRSGFKELLNMLTKLGQNALSSIGKALEHDPNNANLPELPPDMVKKVQMLLKIIPKEDILAMPEGEPDCNCMYCQINRILRESSLSIDTSQPDILAEGGTETVEEKDLEFSEWIVEPIQDKLYKVTNKLDPKEEYRVFLGDPIGCTCGKPHCEHVLAVLKS
jgi:hypothetical protein